MLVPLIVVAFSRLLSLERSCERGLEVADANFLAMSVPSFDKALGVRGGVLFKCGDAAMPSASLFSPSEDIKETCAELVNEFRVGVLGNEGEKGEAGFDMCAARTREPVVTPVTGASPDVNRRGRNEDADPAECCLFKIIDFRLRLEPFGEAFAERTPGDEEVVGDEQGGVGYSAAA